MIELTVLRRYASYAGVVIAAVASVATSSGAGQARPATETGDDPLTTEAPQVTHHFTVNASGDQTFSADVKILWDEVAPGSGAEVLIRLTGDGASKSDERVMTFADFVAGGSNQATAFGHVSAGTSCGGSSCDQGYTVMVTLQKSAPMEHIGAHWTVTAALTDQTSSGSVSVNED